VAATDSDFTTGDGFLGGIGVAVVLLTDPGKSVLGRPDDADIDADKPGHHRQMFSGVAERA
jgi:hypothetical protein